jgi:transposase InsO family protein
MPWKETDALKERVQFVLDWEREWKACRGMVNLSALCRAYGISRPTGYKWVERYQAAGRDVRALEEHSRRPLTSPDQLPAAVVDWIVRERKNHPTWGARKLRALLLDCNPADLVPAESTIGNVLRRHGLSRPRKRRRRVPPATRPFAGCEAPNDVWCIDFKGQFRLGNGHLCYPLTVVDAYSRFLIRCEALLHPTYAEVYRVLDRAFQEFGLPATIKSDNGEPWVSNGAGGLTRLSLWWLLIGLRHDRIEPGKPQQNGRLERFHRTLKEETVTPPARTLVRQQRRFDVFRKIYNEERPHEALGQRPPDRVYERSARSYPRKRRSPEHPYDAEVRIVDKQGRIEWRNQRPFITPVLYGEPVELRQVDNHLYQVLYGELLLGTVDERNAGRGIQRPRQPRRAHRVKDVLG